MGATSQAGLRSSGSSQSYVQTSAALTGLATAAPVSPRPVTSPTQTYAPLPGLPQATSTEQVKRSAEREFDTLADEWLGDTRYESRVQSMILHPSYQRIIGMGDRALPLILKRMAREPGHWFPALHALTTDRPVPPSDDGDLNAMTRGWLQWGRKRQLLN